MISVVILVVQLLSFMGECSVVVVFKGKRSCERHCRLVGGPEAKGTASLRILHLCLDRNNSWLINTGWRCRVKPQDVCAWFCIPGATRVLVT